MIAETRLERFIMEAADKSPETTPITRIETYLSDIANDRVSTLPPISRIELYLAKISGADVQIPRPILRIEMYLAALAGMDIEVPAPVTREEYLLAYWLENQGGEVVLIEGAAPLTLAGALAYAIHSLTQYGLCTQSGTPTPSAPVDIMCNNGALKWNGTAVVADGTPEELTVSGKNLFTGTIEQGNISSATGENTNSSTRCRTQSRLPVKPSTEYTISCVIDGFTPGTSKGIFLYQYLSDGTWLTSGWKDPSGYTFTTNALTESIRVVFAFANSGTPTTPDMISNVQLEYGDAVTAYQEYVAPQTATVDDLLAVGDYKDTHDIISGSIERNVGVILYDGSEDESWSLLDTNAFAIKNSIKKVGKYAMLCSHYVYTEATSARCSSGEFGCSSGNQRTVYFKNELYDTVEDWIAALAADPIIVIYPLATATTEQGTAQHLVTHNGTNVVDVSANVGPVELAVEYMAEN